MERNGKQGLINRAGEEIYPCECEYISLPFRDGITTIKRDGKYGYIDESGATIIPCTYDNALYFINGRAEVQENNNRYFIDTMGNKIQER